MLRLRFATNVMPPKPNSATAMMSLRLMACASKNESALQTYPLWNLY
jgi:hypothetical protein